MKSTSMIINNEVRMELTEKAFIAHLELDGPEWKHTLIIKGEQRKSFCKFLKNMLDILESDECVQK